MVRKRLPVLLSAAIACVAFIGSLPHCPSSGDSVVLEERRVRSAKVYVITADLSDPSLKVGIGLPAKGISHSEPFMNIVRRRAPIAAVTGTYFCTRSLLPVGTVVSEGRVRFVNCIGNTLCFFGANRVEFIDSRKGENVDLTGAQCAVRAGPRLLKSGQYAVSPRREGFRDPGLFGRRSRVAVGLTRHNKLLLVSVATPVTFGTTAAIMKSLGAADAMCLDGGSSSAMYFRGRVVRAPGRQLTNVIELHKVTPALSVRDVQAAAPQPIITRPHEAKPAEKPAFLRRPTPNAEWPSPLWDQFAVLNHANLGRPERGGPFLPIHRTKLTGLKSLKHPERLIHAPAHA